MSKITWLGPDQQWFLVGDDTATHLPTRDDGEPEFLLTAVGSASMESLLDAVKLRAEEDDSDELKYEIAGLGQTRMSVQINNPIPSKLHRWGYLPPLFVYLLEGDELGFTMTAGVGYYVDPCEILNHIQLVLSQEQTQVLDITLDEDGPASEWWLFSGKTNWRERTVEQIYTRFLRIAQALQFPNEVGLTPVSLYNLLKEGYADAVMGQRESQWLEVKKSAYQFGKNARHDIEFPQDVAQFANGDEGGLLLIGWEEKEEVVVRARPMPALRARLQSYRDRIGKAIYPPIEGLQIQSFELDDGVTDAILIPRQREELKPFIVTGAIVNGAIEGRYLSIVRRTVDSSTAASAPQVHALLSAGRSFLMLERGDGSSGSS